MRIEICMGSSCFARGNSNLLHVLEDYISDHEELKIDLLGHLCLGECAHGPNIRIDGALYQGLDATEVVSIIETLILGEETHET